MLSMEEYAKQYQHKHRNEGKVTEITDYSFKFECNPPKDGKQRVYYVMKSYFYGDWFMHKNGLNTAVVVKRYIVNTQ